jgi:phosphoribosylaminoimidazole-succinocarboxamide synthase
MGSVKDLITEGPESKYYVPPKTKSFGKGVWKISGRFSIGDLKYLIPHDIVIPQKAEALTMMAAAFLDHLDKNTRIDNCYLGLIDGNGDLVSLDVMIHYGEISDKILMRLAHTPDSYCQGNLKDYREALKTRELRCAVADVESIFRAGFPLGSSTFERICKAAGYLEEYKKIAKYEETVNLLSSIRLGEINQDLEKVLKEAGLDEVPNPGFVLKNPVYDSTTKFEEAGDRKITSEEARILSGLDEKGYKIWTEEYLPKIAQEQIKFCSERGILNIDGKLECVTYHGRPVLTDLTCTVDENRLMIKIEKEDGIWAIPSNKEIQRAIFREAGVYVAIAEAKALAEKNGNIDKWRDYMQKILQDKKIDIVEISKYSCELMGYAIGEVANRILGINVFETKPIESWVKDFMPYASKIEYQK